MATTGEVVAGVKDTAQTLRGTVRCAECTSSGTTANTQGVCSASFSHWPGSESRQCWPQPQVVQTYYAWTPSSCNMNLKDIFWRQRRGTLFLFMVFVASSVDQTFELKPMNFKQPKHLDRVSAPTELSEDPSSHPGAGQPSLGQCRGRTLFPHPLILSVLYSDFHSSRGRFSVSPVSAL